MIERLTALERRFSQLEKAFMLSQKEKKDLTHRVSALSKELKDAHDQIRKLKTQVPTKKL